MEKLVVILFVLLLLVFIGNVVYKESFADCNSPGQTTWTITLGPQSSSCGRSMNVTDASGNENSYDGRDADSVDRLNYGSSSNPSSGSSSNPSSGSSSDPASKPSGIELSLTDLMALIGSTKDSSGNCPNSAPAYNYRYVSASIPQPPAPPAPQVYVIAGPPATSLNSQFPSDLRTNTLDNVVGSYADSSGSLDGSEFQDNRIPAGSLATRQGVQYVKGAPSNNPAENPEYIRKDSIPCYACSP